MCPNCKKDTFSAWDKMKSTKPKKCSECGIFVKPAFFRYAISTMVILTISSFSGVFTVFIVMKPIGTISFTYIWLLAIPFIIGTILPIIPWIKINDWFVPWISLDTKRSGDLTTGV